MDKAEADRLASIDNFIMEATTRKSRNIWAEGTTYLREKIVPILSARTELPQHVIINAVRANRGFAHYRARRITVPSWAFSKFPMDADCNIRYLTWYLAHELAHIANWDEFNTLADSHGPNFMRHLKRICPENCVEFELDYKPRNAAAAGIGDYNNL